MIEINNLTKYPVDKKSFTQVAKKILLSENKGIESVSLALVDKEEMQKLNKKFRNIDKPTDVLSFEEINEVVICPEVVDEKGEEIMEVFVHGVLHLCGYDHEKSEKEAEEMEAKEKKYLSNF
jgi:probable rRNA maturation factor